MTRYFSNLVLALLGRNQEDLANQNAALRADIATLQFNLQEQREVLARVKNEFAALEASSSASQETAAQARLDSIMKSLCGPLSHLALIKSAAIQGKSPSLTDLSDLLGDLDRVLQQSGLQQVGTPGEECAMDLTRHQNMGGGSLPTDFPVRIQVPGYQFKGRLLQKALVSAKS